MPKAQEHQYSLGSRVSRMLKTRDKTLERNAQLSPGEVRKPGPVVNHAYPYFTTYHNFRVKQRHKTLKAAERIRTGWYSYGQSYGQRDENKISIYRLVGNVPEPKKDTKLTAEWLAANATQIA